jgi:hypothetical protein
MEQRLVAACKQHVRVQAYEFGSVAPSPIELASGPTKIDPKGTSINPSQALKRLSKRSNPGLNFSISFSPAGQNTDPTNLLRPRRNRPSRAGDSGCELASIDGEGHSSRPAGAKDANNIKSPRRTVLAAMHNPCGGRMSESGHFYPNGEGSRAVASLDDLVG